MDLAALIPIVLQLSIALIVVAIGLQASPGDIGHLVRRPSLLVRSVLAMNVILPLAVVGAVVAFKLKPAVEVALLVLAVSPVPPILPKKEGKAGGNVSYAIGLLAVAAALAIVTVPASIAIIGRVFGRTIDVPTATIAKTVLMSVLIPLFVGVVVARIAPAFAQRVAGPLSKVATVLLVLAFIPVLVKSWPAFASLVGDGTLIAILAFTVVGLAVGHALGGPDPDERTVLALSTASRHPAVAMGVAAASVEPEHRAVASAAVLLCFLVSAILTGPYAKWRKRASASAPATPPQAA